MITITIFDYTKERADGLVIAGKMQCHCGTRYDFFINREIRCKKCGANLAMTEGGLVAVGLWSKNR